MTHAKGLVKATVTSHSHQNKSRTSVVMKNGCFYVDHNRFVFFYTKTWNVSTKSTNSPSWINLHPLKLHQLQWSDTLGHHDEGHGHRMWPGDCSAGRQRWLLSGALGRWNFISHEAVRDPFLQLELAASLAEAANLDVFTQLQVIVRLAALDNYDRFIWWWWWWWWFEQDQLNRFEGFKLYREQNQALQRLCVSLSWTFYIVMLELNRFLPAMATRKANLSSLAKSWFRWSLHTSLLKAITSVPKRWDCGTLSRFFATLMMIQVYISLMTRKVIDAIKDPSTLDDKDYYGNKRSSA